jgi:hypothetical protein
MNKRKFYYAWICFFCILFVPPVSFGKNLIAVITAEEAFVYEKPDFDAQIIGAASKDQVYAVSQGKREAFHKIRLKPGVIGWISEVDFEVLTEAQAKAFQQKKKGDSASSKNKQRDRKKKQDKLDSKSQIKNKKPIHEAAYWGPLLHWANFTENTMGAKRSDPMYFLGARLSGPGTLFLDRTFTDASLALAWGAPKYYQRATGRSADGWLLLADYLYVIDFPQSAKQMSFFGWGPMFRYSHFNASLPPESSGARELAYSLDDMALGAVFSVGMAYKIGDRALRVDGKYHWEKQQYFGLGFSFQFAL